jgi:hypothetical protein
MKEITLRIPEDKYKFFMELVKSLGFVKIKQSDSAESKEATIENLKQGFKELKQYQLGQLKTTSAQEYNAHCATQHELSSKENERRLDSSIEKLKIGNS